MGKKHIKNKKIIGACLFIYMMTFVGINVACAQEPGEVVVETIDRALKILHDESLQGVDQSVERKQKLWGTLKPVFDFEETSKRTLGRHWVTLNSEQKQKFAETFRDILRDIYLGKSDSYQGEKIVYIREIVRGNRGKVQTNFFTVDQKKIVIDFSMHKVAGMWKIYDVIIEGVSMVGNYRSQFNSLLSKGSFEDLLEKLMEKREAIVEVK